MSDATVTAPRERDGHPLFIAGYFGDRILNGETPKYGYPPNHVPDTGDTKMTVVTGFIAALTNKK